MTDHSALVDQWRHRDSDLLRGLVHASDRALATLEPGSVQHAAQLRCRAAYAAILAEREPCGACNAEVGEPCREWCESRDSA